MRLFVAIELGGTAMDALLAVHGQLVEHITRQGVRLVRPDKLHLTLVFLGDVDESHLDSLKSELDALSSLGGMSLSLGSLGGFPDLARPKVVWLGLREGVEALAKLASQVATITKPFAPQQDDRPFSPHVTLARVSPGSKEVGRIVGRLPGREDEVEMEVRGFSLVQSRADGSYERLHEVLFKA